MTYRSIRVDGKDYEYVVGKDVVKIKDFGVFPKYSCDYVGVYDTYVYDSGEIAETPEPRYIGADTGNRKTRVTPTMIADCIRNPANYVSKELRK